MLLSKGRSLFRLAQMAQRANSLAPARKSHEWAYRTTTSPPSKYVVWSAEFVQGVAWWWILWHLYTEPGHIFGEFDYPDPSQWTDEELGIPAS